MSTGLPMTCTPMNTITVMANTTNAAWISRRISQVTIYGCTDIARVSSSTRGS